MKGIVGGIVGIAWIMVGGFVEAQTGTIPSAQTNPPSAAAPPGPAIVVSPNVLDFGLVGVGRTKQLTFTLQNTGSGTLTGTATAAAPFQLSGNAYSLQKGQSQSVTVQYGPTAEGSNTAAVAFSGGGSATVNLLGRARTPPRPPGNARIVSKAPTEFAEEQEADVIIRYYSDSTSYLLKPAMMDGPYRSIYDRARALAAAAQQPGRQLAVVVLIHYPGAETEDPVKQKWLADLAALGYQRIVFLRGNRKMEVKGLAILPAPPGSRVTAGK